VAHAWGVIAASMALFAWWPNPFTFLLGVMVIGGRQLGLAILMHDAAHGLLLANRRANDRVGAWLCAWPVFASLALYRPYHLQHHRFTQQEVLNAINRGKKKQAEEKSKKPPSAVPAIYRDVKQTPLREVVPPPGKVELALRSGAR
jgi:fatty acid desaturase